RKVVIDLLELLQRRDAVDPRHHHIDDGSVERKRLCELEPFRTGRGETHVVPLAREERLENLAHDFFVVDDQNRTSAPHDWNPALIAGPRELQARPAPAE